MIITEIIAYVLGLVYCNMKPTLTVLAKMLKTVSHDQLTRLLHQSWNGQELIEKAIVNNFSLKKGNLVVDDSVIEKSSAKINSWITKVYSGSANRPVLGISVVMLIWTNGIIKIPLSIKVWRPDGPSKIELTLEMLSYARNRLKIKPEYVLFDSWYPAEKVLKRIKDYGWKFVTRLRKNRSFNGKRLVRYKPNPYWTEIGYLKGNIKVLVVRVGKKYFATNHLSLTRAELLKTYSIRQNIEDTFKALKSFFGWRGCQVREYEPYCRHLFLGILAFLAIQLEAVDKGVSVFKAASDRKFERDIIPFPQFELILNIA